MKLSVIIPVYNTDAVLLQHCIDSMMQQEGYDMEFLFIDDGSTLPHVSTLLQTAAGRDGRFHHIRKANSGVSATRNMGIEQAQGDYMMFVDSDDYLESDACRYAISTTEQQNADLAVFGFRFNNTPPKRHPEQLARMLNDADRHDMQCRLITHLMGTYRDYGINFAYACTKIYRSSIIRHHNIRFDHRLRVAEDVFFNLCYLEHARRIYVDNKCLYHYVVNAGSVSRQFSDTFVRATPVVLSVFEQHVTAHHPSDRQLHHALALRALFMIRSAKACYFCHPQNKKPFSVLKDELHAFLSQPVVRKWTGHLRLSDGGDKNTLKNIVLLKLRLYWLFLLTERRSRR